MSNAKQPSVSPLSTVDGAEKGKGFKGTRSNTKKHGDLGPLLYPAFSLHLPTRDEHPEERLGWVDFVLSGVTLLSASVGTNMRTQIYPVHRLHPHHTDLKRQVVGCVFHDPVVAMDRLPASFIFTLPQVSDSELGCRYPALPQRITSPTKGTRYFPTLAPLQHCNTLADPLIRQVPRNEPRDGPQIQIAKDSVHSSGQSYLSVLDHASASGNRFFLSSPTQARAPFSNRLRTRWSGAAEVGIRTHDGCADKGRAHRRRASGVSPDNLATSAHRTTDPLWATETEGVRTRDGA
jgi:hypothetical protein